MAEIPQLTEVVTEAQCFLLALDPEATAWTFQTFDEVPDRKDKNLIRQLHGTIQDHAAELERLNRAGAGVFVTINETDLKGRKAENIQRVRACFADFDFADPATLDRLRAFALPPSIIVESSPKKYHAYWLVDDLALDQFTDVQKRIIHYWHSDPKPHDLPRVMRLPGFLHQKKGTFQTLIIDAAGTLYTAADLIEAFPAICAPVERLQAPSLPQADRYAHSALERAIGAVTCAQEGSRNDALNREAFGLFGLVKAGRLNETHTREALQRAGTAAGLVQGEIEATLKSAWSRSEPRYGGMPDTPPAISASWEAIESATEPPSRFRLLSTKDLRDLPELDWRIDNVLPMTGIGLVIGQSGHGKSFVTIDLLARVSLGLPWFGHDTRPCKAVYCVLEGRAGSRRRIEAWERYNDQVLPDAFAVVLDSLTLTAPDDVHGLAHAILEAGGKGGLIVIDTLAQSAPGTDENSSAEMGKLIKALQHLQELTGGLVLAVHHMGKDTTRGARGHSSLYAACDAVISANKVGTNITISTHGEAGGKSKDAEPVEHAASMERVVLHKMDDGNEISSVCLVACEITPVTLPRKPRGKHQATVWDALGGLLRDAGDIRPAGAPEALPEGRPAVHMDAARDAIGPLLVVTDPKHRITRFTEAISGLVSNGFLVHMDGWLWVK